MITPQTEYTASMQRPIDSDEKRPMTNADKIRQMSDEELAKLLRDFVWAFPRSETGWINWLRQEADNG